MSVTNNTNSWTQWSNDFTTGSQLEQNLMQGSSSVTGQVSNISNQISNYIAEFDKFQINQATFIQDVAPLIAQMNSLLAQVNGQYGNSTNPYVQQFLSNLNGSWTATAKSLGLIIPNPSGQGTIPVTVNSNGSETITFTDGYTLSNGKYILNGYPNGNSFIPSPTDSCGDLEFDAYLAMAITNPGKTITCSWNPGHGAPTETISLTNNNGVITVSITATPNSSNGNPFGANFMPDVSSLNQFTSNPLAN